ncbi:MAG: AI-2E family transporter [Verrucomicrobia bacterium]|nr:AI-2E family transporter [Verrucomicrobiota bacterium]
MQRTSNAAAANALVGLWRIALTTFLILTLYFGRDVLIPAALAGLLAFVFSPMATRLERWIGRIAAVLFVVSILCAFIVGTGWILTHQLVDVGIKLPDYQVNIEKKIRAFQIPGGGAASRLLQMITELRKELPGAPEGTQKTPAPEAATGNPPMPVEIVRTPETGAAQWIQKGIVFFLGPLGKTALVMLLLIFILMQREDILNRLIRLTGQGNISATTLALGDAGGRLARYLRFQLLVNITYGISVAIGLYFLGIPNAILWGGLAGLLRFIPYVGPWLGAAPPLALALAIAPNWVIPLLTFGYFIVLELINSNAVEPWLYGSVTGVTPLAIVAGAVFWTWIWGPIGLLLTTPLMVCLVVLGRHVPQLTFLTVLLSDERALTMPEETYHRLLAYESEDVSPFIETYLENHPLIALYNDVLLPVLGMAEIDYQRALLYQGQRDSVFRAVREILEDLREHPPSGFAETVPPPGPKRSVCCLAARTERDELSARMLAHVLENQGFTVVLPHRTGEELMAILAENKPQAICISSPSSAAHARRLSFKLRAHFPDRYLLVGLWGAAQNESEKTLLAAGANGIAYSLMEAIERLRSLENQSAPRNPP